MAKAEIAQHATTVATQSAGARRPLRVGLVGGMHVGIGTALMNVLRVARLEPDIEPVAVPIEPYRRDGIERFLPFLPASMRGTARYLVGTGPLFREDLDAVWAHLDLPLLPWILTKNLPKRVSVVYATDSTPRQLRAFGEHYGHWGGRSDLKFRAREALYAAWVGRVTAVQAWSEWASRSLREDYGVPSSRIHVLPPGVDTSYWKPASERSGGELPRVIFVGGDFYRKGGDILVDVYREQFRGRLELHVVTGHGQLNPQPGLNVHTGLTSNDGRLQRLYQASDLLVIPTRADCFSMAGLEAMSSGLPVITCPIGGVAELFTHGHEGFFVPPEDGRALAHVLEALIENPVRRKGMGAAARDLCLRRYDANVNSRRLFDLLNTLVARSRRSRRHIDRLW